MLRNRALPIAMCVAIGAGAALAQQTATMPAKSGADMPMTPGMEMPAAGKPGANAQMKIQQAMRAAPPEISAQATVIDFPAAGSMSPVTLRTGSNGWTCVPSSPEPAAGAATEDPMCMDRTFMTLMEAWMSKSDPKLTSPGVAYMLRGDKGASNTDPFAMAPTPGNQWVVSPAHIMIALPDPRQLDGFPSDPHAGGPWVMWKGTKYAHLMVPTAAMPKAAAMSAMPMKATGK